MQISVDVVADATALIKRQIRDASEQAITKAAFDIEAQAKQGITTQDAIDTGATKASIYASTPRVRKYSQIIGRVRTMRGPGQHSKTTTRKETPVFDEVVPFGPLEAIVTVGTQYAQYIEYGTKRMAARPFMEPAAEAVIPNLENIIVNEINKIL